MILKSSKWNLLATVLSKDEINFTVTAEHYSGEFQGMCDRFSQHYFDLVFIG